MIVSHLLRVLGRELVFSGRVASAYNHLTFFFFNSQFLLLERDCIMPTLFLKDLVTGKSHDSYVNFSIKIINVSPVEEPQCKQSFLPIAPHFYFLCRSVIQGETDLLALLKMHLTTGTNLKIFYRYPFLLSQSREKE